MTEYELWRANILRSKHLALGSQITKLEIHQVNYRLAEVRIQGAMGDIAPPHLPPKRSWKGRKRPTLKKGKSIISDI